MNNTDFWASVRKVIDDGFTPEGLSLLDRYAEQFIDGRLVYKRFSPFEQHGCAKGGDAHVIASLLAGAEDQADHAFEGVKDNQREFKQGEAQAKIIEAWAKSVGLWMDDAESYLSSTLGTEIAEGGEAKVYDHGATLIKSIGLDYYILPILALDRISLHMKIAGIMLSFMPIIRADIQLLMELNSKKMFSLMQVHQYPIRIRLL